MTYNASAMSGPLDYQRPQKTTRSMRRPGQISFIGSMSVLFGIIGIASAIGWGSWCVSVYQQTGAPATVASKMPSAGKTIPNSANKTSLFRQLLERQPINDARMHLLDALIANTGETITANARLIDHGRLPSESGDKPQYFEFRVGRIELYDSHAIFRPANGPAVRVTPDDIVDTKFASGLTPADVKILMHDITQRAGDGLSAQQEQAIRSLIAAGAQKLVDPSRPMNGQIVDVKIDDNEATIRTQTGWVRLKKDGTVTRSGQASTRSEGSGSLPALALACGVCALSMILATILLVLGIATLQQKLWVRRWLIGYSIAKIVLVLLGVAVITWFLSNMSDETHGNPTLPLLAGSLAVCFPIGLLLLLNRQQVKDYYLKADPFEA